MNIRQATLDDAKTLAELNRHVQQVHVDAMPTVFKPPDVDKEFIAIYIERLQNEKARIFMAEDNGQPVGYVYAVLSDRPENPFSYARKLLVVDEISVNPSHYGSGVADKLMQAVAEMARQNHVDRIQLSVYSFNERAIRFYEKQGFQTITYRMELVLE